MLFSHEQLGGTVCPVGFVQGVDALAQAPLQNIAQEVALNVRNNAWGLFDAESSPKA